MIAVNKRCKFYATKWMYRYLLFQIEVDEDGIRLKTNIYKYPTTKYNLRQKNKIQINKWNWKRSNSPWRTELKISQTSPRNSLLLPLTAIHFTHEFTF